MFVSINVINSLKLMEPLPDYGFMILPKISDNYSEKAQTFKRT